MVKHGGFCDNVVMVIAKSRSCALTASTQTDRRVKLDDVPQDGGIAKAGQSVFYF